MIPVQLSKTHRIKKVDLLDNHVLEETQDGGKNYETISQPGTYQECFNKHKEISKN